MIAALLLAAAAAAAAPDAPAEPQASAPRQVAPQDPWSLDLTIHDFGLGIGNSRHIDGLRLNFRDVKPYVVHGVSLTIWSAQRDAGGYVTGLAIGLPIAATRRLRGVGVGFG